MADPTRIHQVLMNLCTHLPLEFTVPGILHPDNQGSPLSLIPAKMVEKEKNIDKLFILMLR